MNLVEVLAKQVQQRPDAPAIVATRRGADRVTTFAELDQRSRRVAALLRETGLGAGDPVLIFHPMSAELYVVLLGVFRLGAVAMFLDPAAGREHIERCCELQTPRALIASPKAHLLRLTIRAVRRIPRKFVIGPWLPGARSLQSAGHLAPLEGCEPCEAESPALLTFTSGSTGQPKAAVRTHGFLLTQHRVLERHLKLDPGEVDLTTLPIFLLANLASGLTSVIPDADLRRPGFIEAAPVLEQMQRLKVTRSAGSPAFFERLLVAPNAGEGFGRLRKIYTGGAPVFPKLLRQLRAAAPEAEVEAVYGSTEAEPIAHVSATQISSEDQAAMLAGQGLLAGEPISEIQIVVIRDQWGQPLGHLSETEFKEMQAMTGGAGEIVVAGDHVLKGYLLGRGDEETKFRVGDTVWHRTGDAGRFDARGRLWLLGRCTAKVQDARGVLYPFAVECVAQELPGIRRAAFVAQGEKRLLAIEPRTELALPDLEAVQRQLNWAQLDEVRSFAALPVDARHNAKIDYPALKRFLAESGH